MRSHVAVLFIAAVALAQADYSEVWQTHDPVGPTEALYVLGIANTDADPSLELIYRGCEPAFENEIYIWALDLSSGAVEQVTDEFYRILAEPGLEPRLVDIDGDNQYEVLFLGEEDPYEGVQWFLYAYAAPGAANEPGYNGRPVLGLAPVAPNPLRKRASIEYTLPARADVRLKVYDAAGRQVRDLSPGQMPAGRHRAVWAADDRDGVEVPAGSYFYVLEADGKTLSRSALKLD